MATPRPITIEAEVRLDVSEQTAITCINILQSYMNMHNDKVLVTHHNSDGTVWYEIAQRSDDE